MVLKLKINKLRKREDNQAYINQPLTFQSLQLIIVTLSTDTCMFYHKPITFTIPRSLLFQYLLVSSQSEYLTSNIHVSSYVCTIWLLQSSHATK